MWSESAFEALFLEHYPRVMGLLVRLVGERTRAEELANDVFWRAYRQHDLVNSQGNVGGWLYRTATNLGIDALRAAGRRRHYEHAAGRARVEAGDAAADPLGELLRAERQQRVRAVLARLKPGQAQILVQRAGGLSYQELAQALGVKRGSVGTMLIRAEAEFQKHYLRLHGRER
ncbi:MAG: sigma-70 family RNA polymerase sigma factor [Terriglobia bacterium]